MQEIVQIPVYRTISSFEIHPSTAKYIDRFRETIIVDETRVDREDSHHQYDISSSKHSLKHLQKKNPVY